MNKKILNTLSLLFFIFWAFGNLYSQNEEGDKEKLAQTGFQFLSVGTSARATALGEAYTTYEGHSEALFYNPAGLARMNSMFGVAFNQMNWIADIKYYSGSLSLNFEDGKYGVFGLSFLSIDYGKFYWTQVADNESGYRDIGADWAKPSAFAIGLGYAKELSDKFSVGGQIKYVKQKLGTSIVPIYEGFNKLVGTEEQDYAVGVLAFDFGTLYKTGFKSLVFGMSIRNFSQEVKFEREGFQLPLTFKIGISFNMIDFFPEMEENHSFVISFDAAHPRSHAEYISIGGEYTFMNMFAIRGGYVTGQDLFSYSVGFGVRTFGFQFDYAFTPFDVFNNVHRFSVGFAY